MTEARDDTKMRLAAAEARIAELESRLRAASASDPALTESEELFRRILDRLPGNVVRRVLHADGRITYPFVSEGLYETFGIKPESVTGQGNAKFDWIHPDDRDAWVAALHHSAKTLTPLDYENRVMSPGGEVRWVRSLGKPQRLPSGDVVWDGIALDVTDRRAAEDAMRAAKDEAEQANQAKSKFLAAASHDLRQPLQSLRFLLAATTAQARDDGVLANLDRMTHCLDSLDGILEALLDISKLDAGVVTPAVSPLPVATLFQRLERELAPLAEAKQLDLRVVPSSAVAASDPALLETILRNLLSNAIKYTETGRVLVGCRRHGEGLRIVVADTGIGIAPAQQQAIFEPFHQVDNTARDRSKGLGLGLAIVARVAQLLGHEIGLSSAPGGGAQFWIDVPRADTSNEIRSEQQTAPVMTNGVDAIAGAHVLLVEDEAMVAESVQQLLQTWGCQVSTAGDTAAALAATDGAAAAPDLIIADYRLPCAARGSDAIGAVRAQTGRDIPGVILTGDTAPERLREAQRSGYNLLHKPVRPARLRALMNLLLTDQPSGAPRCGS